MKKVLLVIYGEIALRGKNRQKYEKDLIYKIRKNLPMYENFWIEKEQGRFLLELEDDIDYDYFIPRVAKVFGVVAVCPCFKTEDQSLETLQKVALAHMLENYGDKKVTFKVETVRAIKKYPMLSQEVSKQVGGFVLENMPNLKVQVVKPEVTLKVELRNSAYIYSSKIMGFGGLPVGSSGKATLLLSGGIDSPVAGFQIAKRGVEIEAIYFKSPPYTSERATEKVKELAEILSSFVGDINLHVVNFTKVQEFLRDNAPNSKLTIFLKRSMLRASEMIAKKSKSNAIVVGDSISQVASQTLHSINAIDSSINMSIIRPLSTMDKQEIIEIAKNIGTYETSIKPFEDCCTIFLPDFPETRPKKSIVEVIEKRLDGKGLLDLIVEAVENSEVF